MTSPKDMSSDEFKGWNEQMSRTYHPDDYHESSSPIVRWIEYSRVQEIFRQLQVQPHHRVLEVGVGVGSILRQVVSNHRFGIDLSSHYLAIARERLGSSVSLQEGNAEDLQKHFSLRSMDRVYCSEVLEHVQHPEKAMQGMFDLLDNGGIAVISVPNDRLINKWKAFLKKIGVFRLLFPSLAACESGNEWHLHDFSMSDLKRLLEGAGFTVLASRGVPFSWLPLRFVASGRKQN